MPLQIWIHYEFRIVVLAFALQLIVQASINPYWLLMGDEHIYDKQRM